jgi:hypothetical protein
MKEPHQLNTKTRRLYDIANVLQSLGLIEKCQDFKSKKLFRWLGIGSAKTQIDILKR